MAIASVESCLELCFDLVILYETESLGEVGNSLLELHESSSYHAQVKVV